MRLKILDLLVCPECAKENEPPSRKYSIQGDFNENKVFDGFVKCPKDHKWQVRDELLKFDKIATDEFLYSIGDIEYGEVDRYPSEVENQEEKFTELVRESVEIAIEQGKVIGIHGSPIVFLQTIESISQPILVVNPDERILRKCQEIAAKKGFYDYLSVVKAESVTYSDASRVFDVAILTDREHASLKLVKDENGLSLLF